MNSIRYCANADRYKKHLCCEAKITTLSDNPQGYDALCKECLIVQMQDDIDSLKKDLKYAINSLENANEIFASEDMDEEDLEEIVEFIKDCREKFKL